MNILYNFIGFINSICLTILCICISIQIPTFNKAFYSYEFKKNGVYNTIGIEKDELMRVTNHLLDYMKGKEENLAIEADLKYVGKREFFNQKEKEHMIDVKNLFMSGFAIRNISFFLFIITIALLFVLKANTFKILAKTNRIVLSAFLLITIILGIIISINFNTAFNVFHEIFFTNDLWILDPNTDLLLNMVPLPFFIDISIFIALILFVMSSTLIILCTRYLNYCTKYNMGDNL